MEINKIYNENCLETMKRMQDCFIDLTITSPPYDNLREYNGYEFDFKKIAKELFRVTKDGGVVVWVVGDATINGSETGTSFRQALFFKEIGFNLHDTMIYSRNTPFPSTTRYYQEFEYMFVFSKGKPNCFNYLTQRKTEETIRDAQRRNIKKTKARTKNGKINTNRFSEKSKNDVNRIKSNIWKYNVGGGKTSVDELAYKHPAIFPEKLAKEHIYSWSNEGDLIYDCFMGSGTTAKMAHLQKRNWIGSEISKEYIDLSNKRLKPYLTQTTLF
jgi:site-specific DNA-methyltransferase (adenine-specific)